MNIMAGIMMYIKQDCLDEYANFDDVFAHMWF